MEESDHRFVEMERRFDNLEDWVWIVVGGFQRRAGRKLEDAIAGTLRLALKRDTHQLLQPFILRTKKISAF